MELAFASPEPMVQYPGQITPSIEQCHYQHMTWNQAVNGAAFDSFYIHIFPALIRMCCRVCVAIQQPGIKVRKRKWYLGIQSKKQPAQVMLQIYRVLGNMEWVSVGHK